MCFRSTCCSLFSVWRNKLESSKHYTVTLTAAICKWHITRSIYFHLESNAFTWARCLKAEAQVWWAICMETETGWWDDNNVGHPSIKLHVILYTLFLYTVYTVLTKHDLSKNWAYLNKNPGKDWTRQVSKWIDLMSKPLFSISVGCVAMNVCHSLR